MTPLEEEEKVWFLSEMQQYLAIKFNSKITTLLFQGREKYLESKDTILSKGHIPGIMLLHDPLLMILVDYPFTSKEGQLKGHLHHSLTNGCRLEPITDRPFMIM
jgi:hypothetical protein